MQGKWAMALMVSEVYAAFKEAKVSDDTARKAAASVAAYESRFAGVELKLERIEGRMNLLTWLIGATGGAMVILGAPSVWLLLRIAAELGALGR